MSNTNKPLVVYHGNCADGFGAAYAFWNMFKDSFEYVAGDYNAKTLPDFWGRDVYLLDFSYKRAVVQQMLQVANKVVFIDHHASAMKDLAGLEGLEYYTDINKSGAVLAWEYLMDFFHQERPVPKLFLHIEDRDLWKFKLEWTREIVAGLFSYDYSFTVWDHFVQDEDYSLHALLQEGVTLIRQQKKELLATIDKCTRRMRIGGVEVPAVNANWTMASDAGEILSKGEPFSASYYDTQDSRVFSLRSTNGVGWDVSVIAFSYGGGGHKHASGFSVPRNHHLATS